MKAWKVAHWAGANDRGRPVVQGGARCETSSGLRPDRGSFTPAAAGGPHPKITRSSDLGGAKGSPAGAQRPCRARDGLHALPARRSQARGPRSPDIDCQLGGTGEAKGREGTGRRFGVLGEGMRFALGPGNAVTGLWRARGVTLALPAAPAGALQLLCRDSDRHSEPETPQRLATSPSHTRPTRPLCNALSDTRLGGGGFRFSRAASGGYLVGRYSSGRIPSRSIL